ncbi:hypothetical protein VTK26DRAFT_9385 [Humicola hyalothermophila]
MQTSNSTINMNSSLVTVSMAQVASVQSGNPGLSSRKSRKRNKTRKPGPSVQQNHHGQAHPNAVDLAATKDGLPVMFSPNGDMTAVPEKSDIGFDCYSQPPPYSASIEEEKAALGELVDLDDSSGEIVEQEVDDLPSAGEDKAPGSLDAVTGDNQPQFPDAKDLPNGRPKEESKAAAQEAQVTVYPPLSNATGEEAAARERAEMEAYRAGGIRFAPWNIPYRRRMQTIAVLMHSLSIAVGVSVFFFLCANPLLWPLVILYLLSMLLSKKSTDGTLRKRSQRFRSLPIWKFFAEYFPAELHKTHDLPPTRKYVFGYHPHGIISHGAFAAFATEALGFSEKFPGITNSLLTLDSNFSIPGYRDYLLALGIQSVSRESINNILSTGGINGEGMGRAVTIVVGGARESLEATPGVMRLVLRGRRGFIKLAVRNGADLVPVVAFGENDLYDQVSPRKHPWLHALQMWVLRTLKFTLPFLHGRGIFNYDVGLMPYRRPLNVVVGRPIKVRQQSEQDMDMAEVERLHAEYMRELRGLWDAYKDVFAKDRTEELDIMQ